MFYPELEQPKQSREMIRRWGGLNRKPGASENEFSDMYGFRADAYPVLSTATGSIAHAVGGRIQGMIGGDDLFVVLDGYIRRFPFDPDDPGVNLGIDGGGDVRLVRMGAYIVVFPHGVIYNTADGTVNQISVEYSKSNWTVGYALCRQDGTEYGAYTASETPPENPSDGALWVDTSQSPAGLKKYDSSLGTWNGVASVYIKITGLPGIGSSGLKQYDGVTLSGFGSDSTKIPIGFDVNGAKTIEAIGSNYIVVAGILTQNLSITEKKITISRSFPDMDYVVECGNRLWGCKYGESDGKLLNEIYACALGDPTNWNRFRGLATDSYAANRGCDGPWTGAVTYGGYPYFFKKGYREKVYPSEYGAHKIVTTACDGVENGDTLAVVNGVLYYQSDRGVIAFDGSACTVVDDPLNGIHGGLACGLGNKYYLYGDTAGEDGYFPLYVYHTRYGLWHIEERFYRKPRLAATAGGLVYMADSFVGENGMIFYYDATLGGGEPVYGWMAQSAVFGCDSPDSKYISRLNFRFRLSEKGRLDIFIRYDSSGDWEHKCHIKGNGFLQTRTAVILPRRCDHFEIRYKGNGSFTLLSLAKITEGGSDCL